MLQSERTLRDVAGVTDIRDVAGVTDVVGVTDTTDVMDITDVADITGGTVRHMAFQEPLILNSAVFTLPSAHDGTCVIPCT